MPLLSSASRHPLREAKTRFTPCSWGCFVVHPNKIRLIFDPKSRFYWFFDPKPQYLCTIAEKCGRQHNIYGYYLL